MSGLHALIAANEPYWGGEAEVVATYWTSPKRSAQTDYVWLKRQAYKEYWDGFVPAMRELREARLDDARSRRRALGLMDIARDELAHFVAFAKACESLRPDAPPLDPQRLKDDGNWDENVALGALRAQHRREHGRLGAIAQRFTEGGYCTLYAGGMSRRGQGGVDELIAAACREVFEDEFVHMLTDVAELQHEALDAAAWERLAAITVEQLRARIHMRNAQLGYVVEPSRLRALCAGAAEPVRFDYDRAGLDPL